MKIAYLVTLFPCWSETFILREIRELEKQGSEVKIFSFKPASEALIHTDAEAYLSRVHYPYLGGFLNGLIRMVFTQPLMTLKIIFKILTSMWTHPSMLLKTLALLPMAVGFITDIKREGITHLHAHWATYPSTAAWIIHQFTGIPYSFTAHAHDIWLEKPLLVEKIKAAKFVVTISEYNKRYLNAFSGTELDNIEVIHCGIDVNEFIFREPTINPLPRLLAVGRLDEIKGFSYLIEACGILRREGIKFRCQIVGEGPLRQRLEEQIKILNLEGVVSLSGAMPQDELRKIINKSTVFIAPSVQKENGDQDGIPVVLMEAMALGVPVISTFVSGIPELIRNSDNGLVVEARDTSQLVEAIKKVIFSEHVQKQYAFSGRSTIEKEFNIKKTVRQILTQMSY